MLPTAWALCHRPGMESPGTLIEYVALSGYCLFFFKMEGKGHCLLPANIQC